MSDLDPVWRGGVNTAGKLRLDDRGGLEDYLRSLAGARIELVIRREQDGRSLQANRYYRGVVIPLLAEHCGYEPEEMHAALKMRLLTGADGKPRSTAALSRKDFSLYVDARKRFAAELGVVIPDPGQVDVRREDL